MSESFEAQVLKKSRRLLACDAGCDSASCDSVCGYCRKRHACPSWVQGEWMGNVHDTSGRPQSGQRWKLNATGRSIRLHALGFDLMGIATCGSTTIPERNFTFALDNVYSSPSGYRDQTSRGLVGVKSDGLTTPSFLLYYLLPSLLVPYRADDCSDARYPNTIFSAPIQCDPS